MDRTSALPWEGCFRDPDDLTRPARVEIEQIDAKTFVLRSGLRYVGHTGIDDLPDAARTLRPEDLGPGGLTDLTSVPTALRWFLSPYGIHTPAALLHDRLTGAPGLEGVTEAQADRFFRFMLHEIGVPWLRRWMMWAAVALRTRWFAGRVQAVSVFAWVVASVIGQVACIWALVNQEWAWFALAALAPLAFAGLWARQYGAGVIAAYTAPWVLPPTALGFAGYGIYWLAERASGVLGNLFHRRARPGVPRPADDEPMSYSDF